MMLSETALSVATYIQQKWLTDGAVPSLEAIATACDLPNVKEVRKVLTPQFLKALEDAGITTAHYLGRSPTPVLTPKQLAVINSLMDLSDKRTDAKKLAELEVTAATFNAWKRDPTFAAYLKERSEALFSNNLDGVHRAVLKSAEAGDIQAAKIVYDKTGYYSPTRPTEQVDLRLLLTRIVEIVTQHVKDPAERQLIAKDLENLAAGAVIAQPSLREPQTTQRQVAPPVVYEPPAIGF